MQINDYGKLCTMMYERLHPTADPQELEFYLSYAKPGEQMLELLCGSGRFLIPFWEKGMSIDGVDLSAQMLEQLEQKLPEAKPALHCCSADEYQSEKRYDYIFITCNSFSLFTDKELAKRVLKNAKRLLSEQGVFVFAVDTVSSAEPGDGELSQTVDQPLEDGKLLRMRMGARYDAAAQVQYYPSVYELWQDGQLLHSEPMDFQTRLYRLGELDTLLAEAGFRSWTVYDRFDKHPAQGDETGTLLYECR